MKNIKRNDIILLCCLIIAGAILFSLFAIFFLGKGETVVIRIDGEEYARLPLNEDNELLIKSEYGENLLIIKDSNAFIKSASCPKQICVATGKLSELTPIICKHNRVSITLE